jgi:PAS domain S-box-containing protein
MTRRNDSAGEFSWQGLLLCILVLAGLAWTATHSYLVFHSLAELSGITIAVATFFIAWNARRYMSNNYLLFIGESYLFVAFLDILHSLAYKGMGVFQGYEESNLATQLWITARYMESLALLLAPAFLRFRLPPRGTLAALAGITGLILFVLFSLRIFPVCFVEGAGLTPFKIVSEYVICGFLATAGILLWRNRQYFDEGVLFLLILSILTTIASEFCFTLYATPFSFANEVGHLFKVLSFVFLYRAIVVTGLQKPFELVFHDLNREISERVRAEENLNRLNSELEDRVAERTKELMVANENLNTEISVRKLAEEKLRTVADFTYDWEYWIDPEGRLVWVSPSSELTTGYKAEEFMADPELLKRIVHPDDQPLFDAHLQNIGEGSIEACEMDFRIVHRSGQILWISHFCVDIAKPDGTSLGRRASNRDITDRKLAEDNLSRELDINKAMSELSGALIAKAGTFQDIADITLRYSKILTDSEHGFAAVINQKNGDLVCHTLTRMMGKECMVDDGQQRIIFPAAPDGHYPKLWGFSLNTRRPFFTNCPGSHPSAGGTPRGHILIKNYLSVPALVGDKLIGLIALANTRSEYTDKDLEIVEHLAGLYAVAIDRQATVEALWASEQQIRGLFNATTDSVMLLDKTAVILAVNEWAAKRRGRASQDMVGHSLENFLPPDLARRRREGMIESARTKHLVEIEEIQEDKCYHVRIFPILDDTGAAVQFATFSRDITERNRMQAMMIEAEKTTDIAGMAAGMAHEIKNPLSGILQSAQVLARRLSADLPANRDAAKDAGCELECVLRYMHNRDIMLLIETIREAASRMAHIVAGMLEFSRKSETERVLSDVNDLIEKSIDLCATDFDLKTKYDFRHIRIERDYAQDLPSVPCTRTQIEQVLTNLLRNAAQAMSGRPEDSSPPAITLRTRLEGQTIRIEVEDNGPGMDEAVQKKIFEPFFTTKPVGEGTGLGLAVSHFIITNNHQGTIAVDSLPGRGTRFTIKLPLTPVTGAGASIAATA